MMQIFSHIVVISRVFVFGVLLSLSLLATPSVAAATPTGSLSCAASTTSSITIAVSYANTGTASANLYRYGAPGNGQIASYPGSTGSGRHVDTGLSGAYKYQLRTGTTVLANVDCVTKAVVAPAPVAPPAPRPPAPTPSPTPTPAPAPVVPPQPAPAAPTPPTIPAPPALPSEDEFKIEELPAVQPQTDELEVIALTETVPTDRSTWYAAAATLLTGLLLALFVFLIRRRKDATPTENVPAPRATIDTISLPVPIPTPTTGQVTRQNVMTYDTPFSRPESTFDSGIDKAFYPSRKPANNTLAESKADDIPDMFARAQADPSSYGSARYDYPEQNSQPDNFSQPPAGPQTELKIQH